MGAWTISIGSWPRLAGLLLGVWVFALMPGCAATVGHSDHDPDLAARPVFDAAGYDAFPEDQRASLGVENAWVAGDGSGNRVMLSRIDKGDGVPRSLGAYAADVDRVFRGRFPDRSLGLLSLRRGNTGLERLRRAGVPWVALAYTRDPATGEEHRGPSCDSTALIMDFGDAYWTLSWNASRGTLETRRDEMDIFLEGLAVRRVP